MQLLNVVGDKKFWALVARLKK